MSTHRNPVPSWSAIAALMLLLGLIRFAHWPEWASILVAATFFGVSWFSGNAVRRLLPRSRPRELALTRVAPQAERRLQSITDVLLPSKREDYYFLFSASVIWSPVKDCVDESAVNLAALAVDTMLRRARDITAQQEPENVSLIRHELGSKLGEMRQDATGRLRAMAHSIQLVLPDNDQQRLDKLASVRKDKMVWEHERIYEQSKREYLGEDVLKDPGSAVVWWLARNDDRVEKTVQDIGLLARLSSAANNVDVPETFQRLASEFPPAQEPDLPGPGLEGPDVAQSANNGTTPADHLDAFLRSMGLKEGDPERLLLARRFADLTRHGQPELAEEIMRRFDEPDSGANPQEAENG